MKGFSVIIPTLNRTTFLINTLKDLVCQDFHFPFEIIVVDQSNQKNASVIKFSKEHQNIKYHHITHFKGLPEARNYGACLSLYNYLLYLDDDIICNPDLLTQHFLFLNKKEIAIVAGGITEKFKKNIDCEIGKFIKFSANPLRGFHKEAQKVIDHAGGGNFSIKKSVFNEVGGLDENLSKGAALYEETDICLRVKKAGHTIFYNYKAHMYHLAAETGGCRVTDIHKYVYSLSRNRTIIIHRYLPWYFRFTAHLYLLKVVLGYVRGYKDISLYKSYEQGKKEGKEVALIPVLNTSN
ncbi:MAG: glycosyltransferase family 2 protein [Polaribacter sp.]